MAAHNKRPPVVSDGVAKNQRDPIAPTNRNDKLRSGKQLMLTKHRQRASPYTYEKDRGAGSIPELNKEAGVGNN